RVFHSLPDQVTHQVIGGGPALGHSHAESVVRDAGGEIVTGVDVQRLVVEDGRVVAVETQEGTHDVEGALWVAETPGRVVSWLGDQAPSGIRVDGSKLKSNTVLQVALQGSVDGLPEEVHVLDEAAPFYRVVRPYGVPGIAVFHATLSETMEVPPVELSAARFCASAPALGLGSFEAAGARQEVFESWQPIWLRTSHTRVRRILLYFDQLGILSVGRRGTFAFLDPGEEIGISVQYRDSEETCQRETHRMLRDPPVLMDDLGARITRLVER
ncbi:MAG: hypothetical protein QGG40_21655, partial [Myxococcota bacterium]|nr:hypothetical protein [Myxococcota bacterium]